MCALAERYQNRAAVRHAVDLALKDLQLGRVDEVVRRVDREQRRLDPLQCWPGVIVARRIHGVQEVVGILRLHTLAHVTVDHLIRLRELQDETGGFQTFIPLAFHPDNTKLSHIPKPSGLMDLKTMAVSRLMLDNFAHIKAYWIMLGIPTAQLALSYGADDIDGTVVHEKIYHDAGSESPQEITVAELRRLIEEAGRVPVERDTLYHEVVRTAGRWQAGRSLNLVSA